MKPTDILERKPALPGSHLNLADQLGSIYIECREPDWVWDEVSFRCFSCLRNDFQSPEHHLDFINFPRAALCAGGARRIRWSGKQKKSSVLIRSHMFFTGTASPHIFHELRPVWDGKLIGEPVQVLDFTSAARTEPLDDPDGEP